MRLGHDFGYFPEPTKSILVTLPKNVKRAKEVFGGLGFQVRTGNCYLSSFIGELDACSKWIQEKVNDWAWATKELAAVAMAFPQLAYAGMQKSLQHEWQFVQCVVPDIGKKFEAVKVSLHKHFLLALFKESLEEDESYLSLAGLPVKKAGLALPNPVATANSNYKASSIDCRHLTQAICGKHELSSANHSATMQEVKSKLKECSNANHYKELELITKKMSCDERRAILCSKLTGPPLPHVLPHVLCCCFPSKPHLSFLTETRYHCFDHRLLGLAHQALMLPLVSPCCFLPLGPTFCHWLVQKF
jgi:hypothetical protein